MQLSDQAKPSDLDSLPESLTNLSLYLPAGNDSFSRVWYLCPSSLFSLPQFLEQLVVEYNSAPFDRPFCHPTLCILKQFDRYNQAIPATDLPNLQVLHLPLQSSSG